MKDAGCTTGGDGASAEELAKLVARFKGQNANIKDLAKRLRIMH